MSWVPANTVTSSTLQPPICASYRTHTQLDLRGNPGLDSATAGHLAPLLHPHYRCGLRRLDLSGCSALGDAGFAALAMNLAQNKMLQVRHLLPTAVVIVVIVVLVRTGV